MANLKKTKERKEAPKKVQQTKIPIKRQINLIQRSKTTSQASVDLTNILVSIITIIAILCIGYLFGYSDIQERNAKTDQLAAKEETLAALKEKTSETEDVERDYVKYSTAYLTDDEKKNQDRVKIIDIVEESTLPYQVAVNNISISGNRATMSMEYITMAEASKIRNDLLYRDLEEVALVEVKTSNNTQNLGYEIKGDTRKYVCNIVITFNDAKEKTIEDVKAEGGKVTTTTSSSEGFTPTGEDITLYAGIWKKTQTDTSSLQNMMDLEFVNEATNLGYLYLSADGKVATCNEDGSNAKYVGTWKGTDSGIVVKGNGTVEYKDDQGRLCLSMQGVKQWYEIQDEVDKTIENKLKNAQ